MLYCKPMIFSQKLHTAIQKNNSLLCIGLDSDIDFIPKHLLSEQFPLYTFNKAIINTTHDLVSSYKFNSAFYEGEGARGVEQLKMTFDYLRRTYPDIPTILDAKRGDIENSNKGYVRFAFEYLGADSLTLHPYLGKKSLEPFLNMKEKGFFILCKTSNEGSGELQNLPLEDGELYKKLAEKVAKEWNGNGNCMLVAGATYPQELKEIRAIVGDMMLLVPGIGKQGGDLQAILSNGLNAQKEGLIIHAGRSIIFASDKEDFAEKARGEGEKLREEINRIINTSNTYPRNKIQ